MLNPVSGSTVTPLRIGNASGFYGDRFAAFREMLTGGRWMCSPGTTWPSSPC